MRNWNWGLVVGLALVAVALLVGSAAIGSGIRDRGRSDVITVTGSAKKRIQSDFVIWDLSVTSQQHTAAAAAAELLGFTTRIRGFLADQGVRADELTVQPIATETVTPQTNNGPGSTVVGYRLTRTFEVRSRRVSAIAGVAEASSKLLAANVPLAAQPPQYVYTNLPSLRPALLSEATKDAQQRAKVLVEATGGHLGGLRSVAVGVFQVTSPNSTQVADYGVYDTTTVPKDVTAVVNVTFSLG